VTTAAYLKRGIRSANAPNDRIFPTVKIKFTTPKIELDQLGVKKKVQNLIYRNTRMSNISR